MSKQFQKLIIFSVVFGLVFGIVFNPLFVKPKQVLATDGGAGWMNTIKEYVLDSVGWAVTDQILKPLKQKIIDWGMGKTTDSNEPFFVVDWKAFGQEILDTATSRLIQKIGATKLCMPFDITIGNAITTPLSRFNVLYGDRSDFRQYGACTLDDIIGNAKDFYENPSIGIYGWDVWAALSRPNNNYLGMYYLLEEEEERLMEEEKEAKDKEVAVSEGTKNETTTTETDLDACKKNCDKGLPVPGTNLDCYDKCETTTKNIPLETKVKNLGTTISGQMKEAMGADMSRIINADEITELIGVFFSSILNKAIDGLGLLPSSANSTSAEKNRSENKDLYGYGSAGRISITPAMEKDIHTNVLTGILKGVQMLSRATLKCQDEEEMITDLDFNKNIVDIYSAQLEALYTGVTGTSLKPDFEVLDSAFAPFSLNGYRWADIPTSKIPAKCRKIIKQANLGLSSTCKDIVSGLEPNYNKNCKQCLYDQNELNCPPAPYPPLTTISEEMDYLSIPPKMVKKVTPVSLSDEQILAKQDFYNKCQNWYGITTERCGDCIKKADAKCNQPEANLKQACIESVCNNYEDLKTHVNSTIASGVDFYNKCLVEETKTSCFTCLKEYFVPAEYCDKMSEYTARALIKYPAVVLKTSIDDGASIGRYDQTFQDAYGDSATECNNDRNVKKAIELSLICKIMPDFTYGGVKICRTSCMSNGMTEEELTDIVDDRPTGKDCNNKKLNIGGSINVWRVIADGSYQQLTKCCAANNTSDYDRYSKCTGATEQQKCTYALPVDQEPQCYCDEGERPLGFTRTGFPRSSGLGGDCGDVSFTSPKKVVHSYTSNQPTGDMFYIATGNCSESQELCENTTGEDTDETTSVPCTEEPRTTDATGPSGVICQWEISGNRMDTECDLTNVTGTVHAGLYHNDNSDQGSNGWHVCAKCDSSDPGYNSGYYGTIYDQCTGKLK